MPAHQPGESIEGLKIQGHSRKPIIRHQRTMLLNGIKCFIVKVEFNVFAEIIVELTQDSPQIDVNALITKGETIGCDTALIATIARTRTPHHTDMFQELASNVTATHSANMWETRHQTNIKVVTPRQEIINALHKRNE